MNKPKKSGTTFTIIGVDIPRLIISSEHVDLKQITKHLALVVYPLRINFMDVGFDSNEDYVYVAYSGAKPTLEQVQKLAIDDKISISEWYLDD